jgi:hypothetical protein
LLNASQFGFRARHTTTLQCMRLTDHVSLNFNNNMSTAAVFLDIEKAFDTTWHPGLLYKLSELQFSTSLVKLIAFFLTNRKFNNSGFLQKNAAFTVRLEVKRKTLSRIIQFAWFLTYKCTFHSNMNFNNGLY